MPLLSLRVDICVCVKIVDWTLQRREANYCNYRGIILIVILYHYLILIVRVLYHRLNIYLLFNLTHPVFLYILYCDYMQSGDIIIYIHLMVGLSTVDDSFTLRFEGGV